MLSALCVVGRMSFTWLPNFKPVTVMILLICLYLGVVDAMIVANIMIVATGIYLGMGYWIFEQMMAYSLIILIYFFLMWISFLRKFFPQLIIVFMLGMIYGLLMSIFEVYLFGMSSFWAYYARGISFDLMHAFGNLVFMIVLIKPFEFFNHYFIKFK